MAWRGWCMGLGIGVAAMVAVAVVPSLKLDAELAAARHAGLWTSAAEARRGMGTVPDGENAAPLIRAAIAADHRNPTTSRERGTLEATAVLGLGTEDVGEIVRRTAPIDALWRAASARPRLDYGRPWEMGYAVAMPELVDVRHAETRLLAAATMGRSPRANLEAAARLAALTRQEPVLIAQVIGIEDSKRILEAARRLHLAREIEPLLGPAPNARQALAMELPMTLETLEGLRRGEKGYPSLSPLERLRVAGPFGATAKTQTVRRWRLLWEDLGKALSNGTAAEVVDAQMPGVEAALGAYPSMVRNLVLNSTGRPGGFLREFDRFDRLRAEARAEPKARDGSK